MSDMNEFDVLEYDDPLRNESLCYGTPKPVLVLDMFRIQIAPGSDGHRDTIVPTGLVTLVAKLTKELEIPGGIRLCSCAIFEIRMMRWGWSYVRVSHPAFCCLKYICINIYH
jgi:hypothetical protein